MTVANAIGESEFVGVDSEGGSRSRDVTCSGDVAIFNDGRKRRTERVAVSAANHVLSASFDNMYIIPYTFSRWLRKRSAG